MKSLTNWQTNQQHTCHQVSRVKLMDDEIPNMDPELRDEIIRLTPAQLSTLFWQTYGWMRVCHFDEITNAIESTMVDVRKEGK